MVQFVPFSKFQNDEIKLSKQVLEEIPKQIVDYYTINNLTPHKIKILLSQENKIEYPSIDEINKFNFDSIPTNETVYINPNNKKPSEIHVSKTYTNLPNDDDDNYNHDKNDNNFSLFNNDN